MPSTYTLISSNTLTSSAASVTFSSIPATYTDLVLKISTRGDNGGTVPSSVELTFNGNNANFSRTDLTGNGSAAASARNSNQTNIRLTNHSNGSASTANAFSNSEIYIPNYNGSTNKPIGSFGVGETNASAASMGAVAGLWGNTSAITSITIANYTDNAFVTGSSFYLYGIKNS